jgi:hypothetical protein
MRKVSIKDVQTSLQKTITWTKKIGKDKQNGQKLVKMQLFTLEIKDIYEDQICL